MLHFERDGMLLDMQVSLYKDSTPGLAPLGVHHKFKFTITQQEIVGNLVAWAYGKIKDYANSDIPNLKGSGTHKGCEDLVNASDV